MAKEFIINAQEDWQDMVKLAYPVVGKKPFRVVLHRGLKRTVDQNSLVHAVFEDCARKVTRQIASTPGSTMIAQIKPAEWWKTELKNKLGKKSVHFDLDEQPTIIVHSTTEYSTKELAEFCEKIVAYMKTEFGVDIELPDEIKEKPPIKQNHNNKEPKND